MNIVAIHLSGLPMDAILENERFLVLFLSIHSFFIKKRCWGNWMSTSRTMKLDPCLKFYIKFISKCINGRPPHETWNLDTLRGKCRGGTSVNSHGQRPSEQDLAVQGIMSATSKWELMKLNISAQPRRWLTKWRQLTEREEILMADTLYLYSFHIGDLVLT